ncbi:hypothetical protein OHB36_18905 [Streptomyces sp. NBC_00320]|uniref:hypothetical protein n=1 Tax=Streptomyces sp. NBC_00320 TaxID=2975711 RepID=UPI00225A0DD5|nr:hypothetical protein [Streptomyces sp. NBC_00320]MCX5148820.1 hypothetical protein [Streptomyces sp. NBC_00320]
MADVVPSQAPDNALARAIVARVAPGELPFFEETVASLDGKGRRGRAGTRRKDDPLAFGGAAELVVTSIACGVAYEVAKAMGEDIGQSLGDRVRRLFGRRDPSRAPAPADEAVPALPEHRIAELGAVARRTALLLGLPPDRSDLLAAAVADHLRASGRDQG